MDARKVMLIRHAERPPDGGDGVMPDGSPDPEALTPLGWQRARALVQLFDPPTGQFADPKLAKPDTIYASGVGHHSPSLRPQQTIAPLAAKLGLTPVTTFLKDQWENMVVAAVNSGPTVLIAWQHEDIPAIAQHITKHAAGLGIPPKWPGKRYDVVWVFDRQTDNSWSFAQVPQHLLPDDLDTVIRDAAD